MRPVVNKHIKPTRKRLLVVVLALFCATINLNAAEVTPAQPVDPAPIGQKFDPMDPNNQLVQKSLNKRPGKANQKKGWFDWLTNISRKPANFHYIDFIELFH